MIPKQSVFHSLLTGSCPRCHHDHMYVNKNPYNIIETMKMHENCSHCGLQYKVEPNFFFGAMYVSYGISVLIGIAVFLLCFYGFETNLKTAFAMIFVGLLALTPVITRFSRNIYINMFVYYRPEAARAKSRNP